MWVNAWYSVLVVARIWAYSSLVREQRRGVGVGYVITACSSNWWSFQKNGCQYGKHGDGVVR